MEELHYQLSNLNILCDIQFTNSVTNDEESVTCKKCKRLLKIFGKKKLGMKG